MLPASHRVPETSTERVFKNLDQGVHCTCVHLICVSVLCIKPHLLQSGVSVHHCKQAALTPRRPSVSLHQITASGRIEHRTVPSLKTWRGVRCKCGPKLTSGPVTTQSHADRVDVHPLADNRTRYLCTSNYCFFGC